MAFIVVRDIKPWAGFNLGWKLLYKLTFVIIVCFSVGEVVLYTELLVKSCNWLQ